MLPVLLMLSGLGRLTSAGLHPETSLLQITVPRKIETNAHGEVAETHDDVTDWILWDAVFEKIPLKVTYAIKIDQKTYTLHLEKQSLLDPHFLVYAYNKSGTLYPDSSFIKGHCLYQGYAAEVPKSVVTLSTCSGLRGLLHLENVSYGIEPLGSAAAYEHMLYQIKKYKVDFLPLQENHPRTQVVDQSYQILVKSVQIIKQKQRDPNLILIEDSNQKQSPPNPQITVANIMKFQQDEKMEELYKTLRGLTDVCADSLEYLSLDPLQKFVVPPSEEKNSDVELLKRILKIQIIMDKALFDFMGSEVAVATEKVVHIIGVINTVFSQLKVTVMLTSLELWSDQNKILLSGDANEILQRFVSWKEQFLSQRSHDLAYLLIYRNHLDYVGATYHGMACNPKFAAGIALYPQMITLDAFSVVMTQLLGINLGLTYDDIYNCYCPGTTCIMNPEAIHSLGVKYFSSCSIDEFKHKLSQPEFECLQNKTVSEVVRQGRTTACGNKIMEPPEQCDCGLPEKCSHKKCCDPVTCTLIGNAECGSGPCCDRRTCLIAERGRLCRKRKDPCDFPEYCNGTSSACVPDVVSADLQPCNNNTAYCYRGICRDPDVQCETLFGKFAKVSTYLCSQEVNFQGDEFGNCGSTTCDFRDILCGKIVCHWTHSQIVPRTVYNVQYTYLGGHICLSAYLRSEATSSMKDLTKVYDGTICGERKYCFNGSCVDISEHSVTANCDSVINCSGHGVCNNMFNCHCDVGYSPPNCYPKPSSPGGSYNDGYWLPEEKGQNIPAKRHAAPRKNGLFISFYIFLPFLTLIAIIALKWNKIRFWNRAETVTGESTSEDSNIKSNQSSS